jgi:hypothetical protein
MLKTTLMQEQHYTVLLFIWDWLKTVLAVRVVNFVGSLSFPAYAHEWISCLIGLAAFYHIMQKIIKEHNANKKKKEDEK